MGQTESTEELLSNELWDEDIRTHPTIDGQTVERWNYKGYECRIVRNGMWMNYCGYVTLPTTHPFYHKHYDNIEDLISVHGGLTYGRDGTFGFDCGHLDDIQPRLETMHAKKPELFDTNLNNPDAHYWTFDEVKSEVESMVDQFVHYESSESRSES